MEFKLDNFEGPLDLLLHLVKQSNMDIYDINLVEIATQYLDYIKNIDNLNIASEYLVMASELLEFKSKSLLPKTEDEVDTYEEDFKKELTERLVEYKEYKELSDEFKRMESLRKEIFIKSPEKISSFTDKKILKNDDLDVDDLINAFNDFLKRRSFEQPLNTTVTKKEYFIEEVIKNIKLKLQKNKTLNFIELFEEVTKQNIIITFLAILEMTKKKEIVIIQEKNFGDILVTIGGKN